MKVSFCLTALFSQTYDPEGEWFGIDDLFPEIPIVRVPQGPKANLPYNSWSFGV